MQERQQRLAGGPATEHRPRVGVSPGLLPGAFGGDLLKPPTGIGLPVIIAVRASRSRQARCLGRAAVGVLFITEGALLHVVRMPAPFGPRTVT